jgi:hypothetical protein
MKKIKITYNKITTNSDAPPNSSINSTANLNVKTAKG